MLSRFTNRGLIRWSAICAVVQLAMLGFSGNLLAGGHGASSGHGGSSSHAASSDHGHSSGHGAPAEAPIDYGDLKNRGIDLGEFRIRAHYPVDAQKSTVQFKLHASVASEHYADIQHVADEHKHLIRDQIIVATRLAPLAVYDDPDLKAFRRRMLVRLRRALPELAIDELHVSEFQLTVRSL
jgi:hypothetical protein